MRRFGESEEKVELDDGISGCQRRIGGWTTVGVSYDHECRESRRELQIRMSELQKTARMPKRHRFDTKTSWASPNVEVSGSLRVSSSSHLVALVVKRHPAGVKKKGDKMVRGAHPQVLNKA
jgi:hypothetical protein